MLDQNKDTFCLNSEYSTTRLVTREKPVIVNKPEDAFETVLFLPECENRTGQGGLRTQGLFKRSLPDKPLITVITVVLNGAEHLEETILSVLNQTYGNVEYIVIDGGSTDGTLDIIQKYEHAIDYWVSEKDAGIYDAMNKGIRVSTGLVLGFLNADDEYYPLALEDVATLSQSKPNFGYAYGSVDLCDETGMIFGRHTPLSEDKIFSRRFREMPFFQLSFFSSRQIFEEIGLFNPQYNICADYDLVLRVLEKQFLGSMLTRSAGKFRRGGKSDGIASFREFRKVLENHDAPAINRLFHVYCAMFKYKFRHILPKPAIRFLKKFNPKSTHRYD